MARNLKNSGRSMAAPTHDVAVQSSKGAHRIVLTHPERALYPRDRITKRDVGDYYLSLAEPLINALRARPVALEHWPKGVGREPWFQQNIGAEGPDFLSYAHTTTRDVGKVVRHLVVDSREALCWLAQHSVLTIHAWSSRMGRLDEPDWVVFDLDPGEGHGIEQTLGVARALRERLEKLELPCLPKTSAKRGLHVYVPLAPGHSHRQAIEFAERVGTEIVSRFPEATMERSIERRHGRLYFDCYQNGRGKTMVAPYSLRGLDGAPVSAPLRWSEVNARLDPMRFNLRTMARRIDRVGDLFGEMMKHGARLPSPSRVHERATRSRRGT